MKCMHGIARHALKLTKMDPWLESVVLAFCIMIMINQIKCGVVLIFGHEMVVSQT